MRRTSPRDYWLLLATYGHVFGYPVDDYLKLIPKLLGRALLSYSDI